VSGAENYNNKCQGVAKGENRCGVGHLTSKGRFGSSIDIIHVITHCHKEVEEELPSLLHFHLHGATPFEC